MNVFLIVLKADHELDSIIKVVSEDSWNWMFSTQAKCPDSIKEAVFNIIDPDADVAQEREREGLELELKFIEENKWNSETHTNDKALILPTLAECQSTQEAFDWMRSNGHPCIDLFCGRIY